MFPDFTLNVEWVEPCTLTSPAKFVALSAPVIVKTSALPVSFLTVNVSLLVPTLKFLATP